MSEENNKLEPRIKNLEALSTVQMHKINIVTSEIALLKMAITALSQQKVMIVPQAKEKNS